MLYENLAWFPLRAIVSGDAADDVPVGAVDPTRAALSADLAGAAVPATGELAPGIVLWGEAYDDSWEATGDASLRHRLTFGWSNGFELDERASVSIVFGDQWLRWPLLGAALIIWVIALRWWWRTRSHAPRRAGPPGKATA